MKTIAAVCMSLAFLAACDNNRSESAPDDLVETPSHSQTVMPAPEEWVVDRYGVKSGIVELTVTEEQRGTGGTRERVAWYTRYFDDFGARTAEYEYSDSGRTDLVRTSIDDKGIGLLYIQGDSTASRIGWPRFMLPNFNRLTDEMRTHYNITEIEGRTVIERECTGYALQKNGINSKLWVWQGIPLYGEVGEIPESPIKPMILQATSLRIDIPIPPEKFQIPQDVPVVDLDISNTLN